MPCIAASRAVTCKPLRRKTGRCSGLPSSSTTAAAWLVAVFGAAAILIGPITPWMLPVELVGVITCLAASGVLAALFFRR